MAGKLRIRPYKKKDGRYLVNWLTQERQMHMWCGDYFQYPLTGKQMDDYVKKLNEEEHSWGFTALDDSGAPVGSFRMSQADYDAESIHLGFIVVDPVKRGMGLGYEMVSMAVRYAVDFIGMKRITLKVFEANPGAKRCYEKAGFSAESYKEKDYFFHDEVWGTFLMVYTVK